MIKRIVTAVVAFIVIIGTLMAVTIIDAGEVGVVKRLGRVTGRVLEPGFHLVTPFTDDVLTYDTKKVIYETRRDPLKRDPKGITTDFTVDTNTKDGQQVDVFFTIRFAVDPTKASWITQNIGSQEALIDKVIRPEARIWARNVPREFEAADLYSGNVVDVQNKIADALRPVYAENGVILDSVGIRELQFEEEYISAIEAKQIEFVKVETEKNRAEQAKYQKEQIVTAAQGTAEEQRLQRDTLTPALLEKLKLDRWDGHYPTTLFIGAGGTDFIVPLPGG